MAVIKSTDQLTALEIAKRNDGFSPDSRRIIEELSQHNQVFLDAPVFEANEGLTDSHLVRTSLPHGEHRGYNEGVGSKASETKTIKDFISSIEIYSTVDKKLIDECAHPKETMQSEQNAFMEGLSQDIATDLFFGNHAADPRYMNGFAIRRNKLGEYCIDMGGTGNSLTSLYMVKWGYDKARLIYPRGKSNIGVNYRYLGEQTVKDANNKEYQAYRALYSVDCGLSVGHQASIIRFANIDLNSINGATMAENIVRYKAKLAKGAGTVSLLCNEDLLGIVNVAALNKTNIILPAEDPFGNEVLKIGEMRFRTCDALNRAESQVTA